MKKSELSQLIRETVAEVFNELQEDISFSAGSAEESIKEGTPPNFPPALKKKLIKKYGETPKAYATMWTLSKKMNEGDERVKEMWTAWEGKKVNEEDEGEGKEAIDQNAEHDETDLTNPEEKEEVELAKQIKTLADKLLTMHGVETGEEQAPEGEETDGEEDASIDAEKKEVPVNEVKKKKITKKHKKHGKKSK